MQCPIVRVFLEYKLGDRSNIRIPSQGAALRTLESKDHQTRFWWSSGFDIGFAFAAECVSECQSTPLGEMSGASTRTRLLSAPCMRDANEARRSGFAVVAF